MPKYAIELPEDLTCDICPCRDDSGGNMRHGYLECQLADRFIPERYEAGEFGPYDHAFHDKPEWCPLVPMDTN